MLPAISPETGPSTETRNGPLNGTSITCAAEPEGSTEGALDPNTVDDASQARLSAPSPSRNPSLLPRVMTVDELATLLRVNRKTVYDALSRGEIPGARRIGGRYRILREAVIQWLASSQDCGARSRRNR
jgi:excisionase family DNA binding protein